MGVDTAPRAAQIKGVPEEGCARRFFEIERWPPEEDAIAIRRGKGQHKDVRRLDAFLLHAGGGYVDLISSKGKMERKIRERLDNTRYNIDAVDLDAGSDGAGEDRSTHPTRMLMPPPVPVTQPRR